MGFLWPVQGRPHRLANKESHCLHTQPQQLVIVKGLFSGYGKHLCCHAVSSIENLKTLSLKGNVRGFALEMASFVDGTDTQEIGVAVTAECLMFSKLCCPAQMQC